MIYYRSPFREDKNLGKALNDEINLIPKGSWICMTDYDTCFLTPHFNRRMEHHIKLRPDTGIFTCYTNRVQRLEQCVTGRCDNNSDIRYWKAIANSILKHKGKVKEIPMEISGVCMMFNKSLWKSVGGFKEGIGCLGVDNEFCWSALKLNKKILLMEDIFIFHYYRLIEGIQNKDHLK